MKQLTQTQLSLLQILGDGACHSGNALGQSLGITRSAVWKQINHLMDLGIPIKRQTQGYQLSDPLILLNAEEIKRYLEDGGFAKPFNLHLFTSIDSTNHYLKTLPKNELLDLCCSEGQTQGRGRFGRHWRSPFGENIYCSTKWNLNCDLNKLSGLSLVTSLAVLATIKEFIPPGTIQVKWPNDIMWGEKKLSGSLIEIIAESNGAAQIIIGIGLNVNTDTQNQPLEDKPWCSLFEISNQRFDRNQIVARLLINLDRYLDKFLQLGLGVFLEEWNQSDYLYGKLITVNQTLNTLSGIAYGIDPIGQLIIEDEQGNTHYFSSGDTTIGSGKRFD